MMLNRSMWCSRFSTMAVWNGRSSLERRISVTSRSSCLSTFRSVCGQIFFGMSLIDLTQALLLGLQNKDVLARGVSSAVEGMTAREAPTPVERSMFDLLSYNYSRSAQTLVGFGVLSFNLPYNSSVRTEIKSVCAPSSRVMFRGVGVMVDTSFFLVWMGGGADK
jgi:hypothetical protein